jgi:hypothetical protein
MPSKQISDWRKHAKTYDHYKQIVKNFPDAKQIKVRASNVIYDRTSVRSV